MQVIEDELRSTVREQVETITNLEDENEKLNSKLNDANGVIAHLKEQLDTVEKTLFEERKEWANKEANYEAHVLSLEGALEEANAEIIKLNSTHAAELERIRSEQKVLTYQHY